MKYYYSENIFMNNPYMAHPDLFRSGYAFLPCTFDDNIQKVLLKRFLANHLFLMLKKSEGRIEGFIFADSFLDLQKSSHYMSQVDLLVKFGRYFKREAADRHKIQALFWVYPTER